MTKHKWYDEIGAWREGYEIEQFWAPLAKIPWAKVSSPQWDDPRLLFRIYDPHREIKEAMARGEVIEEMDANGIWRKPSDWAVSRGFKFQFTNSPDRYRIAPKPTEFNFTHANQGGTFATNFDKEKKAVYVETIRRFADPDIVLCEKSSPAWPSGGGSLHTMDGSRDLSDFWRVFYQVEKDLAEKEIPKPDPYQHLRDAKRAGKSVRALHLGEWVDVEFDPDACNFGLPPDQYRIAPKPDDVVVTTIYSWQGRVATVSITFNGETNKAKSVRLVE